MSEPRRYLFIGAHPDDPDIRFGATAVKLVRAGHIVKFVSLCRGDCGHFAMTPDALAERRWHEAQEAKKRSGICEYEILSNHDCELEPSLAVRRQLIGIIRRFDPDVILSHRLCDYHPDHRAAAQLVMDCAYVSQVPMFCPEFQIQKQPPIFAFVYDDFTDPRPVRPDAAVPFDDVAEDKCRLLDCHVSQVYEWLPWDTGMKDFDASRMTWDEKFRYLHERWGKRFIRAADLARETLIEMYGETGRNARHAEVFEYSPYGRKITVEEFRDFFRV